jgi:PEP-CTERM/exosortase A-associated glycosyltransferase
MPTPASPKILHILDHSLPLHSGYSFRSESILGAQRNRGWQPVVLTSLKHEESWKGPKQEREEINGFTYYRTGALRPGGSPFPAEVRRMNALARRMREVAAIEKPDLLHAHSPVLNALPALRVGRQLGIPVVYEIRAFWEDAAVDHGTYAQNSWKYRLVRWMESQVCRRADQVTVLCQGLKEDLIRRGIPAGKFTVVYNGIEPARFQLRESDAEYRQTWKVAGKNVIGFIGSFYRYEGLDLLVDAFARLVVSRPDVVLLLVGGGEMETQLKAQIQRLKLEDRVILPGRVPHDRIPGVYALMDILVYPRYSMRLTELVTPLKPLEAMAMGKALIASDVGGHRELIHHGQTGLLFPAGDTATLAEMLDRLMNDPEARKHMGEQESVWVRREHSWDKTTAVYAEVYARALEDRSAGPVQNQRSEDLGQWEAEPAKTAASGGAVKPNSDPQSANPVLR